MFFPETKSDSSNDVFAEGGAVPDIEDMITIGRKHGVCPLFRCRHVQATAELVLLPFDYMLDPQLRKLHEIDLLRSIVIFDDADGLEIMCESLASPEITSVDVHYAILETKAAIECLQREIAEAPIHMGGPFGCSPWDAEEVRKSLLLDSNNALDVFYRLFVNIVKVFDDKECSTLLDLPGKILPGLRLFEIFDSVGISHCNAERFSKALMDISRYLQQGSDLNPSMARRGKHVERIGRFVSSVYRCFSEKVHKLLIHDYENGLCQGFDYYYKQCSQHYNLYILKEEQTDPKPSILMKFWCLTSSVAMDTMKCGGVRTVIVTGSTLPNLDRKLSTLQGKHEAKADQIIATVLRESPFTKRVLNGCPRQRWGNDYAVGVAESITSLAKIVPQGILVFFASSKHMDHLIRKFKELKDYSQKFPSNSYWDQMTEAKLVVVEPKEKSQVAQARSMFAHGAQSEHGAMYLAVCGGQVGEEGIAFSDACSRAVCVVGIPIAPLRDIRILSRRRYLKKMLRRGGANLDTPLPENWCDAEECRAVKKALGLVVRHVHDFGVVVLLDARFERRKARCFPSWMGESVRKFEEGSQFLSAVTNFFAQRKKETTESIALLAEPAETANKMPFTARSPSTPGTSCRLPKREAGDPPRRERRLPVVIVWLWSLLTLVLRTSRLPVQHSPPPKMYSSTVELVKSFSPAFHKYILN
uniref:Helicase ATP-binding domain-containing protein n=1 Tax=Angiostrongylus cantonensis TaxID=6313 RepID=A0A0K0DNA0_ANGCA